MANFDVNRYLGEWYEIVRDKATPFELLAGCVIAEYGGPYEDGSIEVTNYGFTYNKGWKYAHGVGVPVGEPGTGSLAVWFDGMPEQYRSEEPGYIVLDTDYDSYSIVYSCGSPAGIWTFDMLWILAREPQLDEEKLESIKARIGELLPDYNLWLNAHYTRQGDSCNYEERDDNILQAQQ